MWTLSNSNLPTSSNPIYKGGILTTIDTGATYSGGASVTIDYTAETPLTGQTPTIATTTGAIAPNTVTISTTQSSVQAVITSGGTVFRPAADINDHGPGEFVHDPYVGTVTLTTGDNFTVEDSQTLSLIGATALTVPTERLEPVPAIARFLFPTARTLTWSLGLEEHPSGTLEIQANHVTLPGVKARLCRGTEFSIYGIGFRCGAMRIASEPSRNYPAGVHVVSITLEGKWQNYVDDPFPFRNMGQLSGDGQTDAGVTDEAVPASYTLTEIATAVGAVYQGPVGIVQVPENAQSGESTTFEAELSDRTRINGSVADYSCGAAIKMKPLRGGRVWDYRGGTIVSEKIVQDYGQLETVQPFVADEGMLLPTPTAALPSSIQTFPTPTLREEAGTGIVIEWENVQLTGEFSEASTEDDGEPTFATSTGRDSWVRRDRETTTLFEGDDDASSPPAGAIAIKDVSLNFDQSGPTKTRTVTTKEDGFVTLVEQWRYGYAFTANEASSAGVVNGSPSAHWKVTEYTRKERLIDRGGTGYAYGWDTTGWRLARFRQETADSPETIAGNDPLYEFQQTPIRESERDLLKQHRDFYNNLDTSDQQGEIIKVTLADGSEVSRYLRNPNYAEPMLVAASSRESVAFISTANPSGAELPPLISGREEYSRTKRDLQPGQKRIFRSGQDEQPGDRTPDLYTDYSVQFTSQDGQFSNSLEDSQFRDYEGRPGQADRLPPAYDREEPPESDGSAAENDEETTKLRLLNSGDPPQYLGQQLNYPAAQTLEQALLAARTDAILENLESGTRETIEVLWNPDFRPGDQFIYELDGEIRRRLIMGVQFNPKWQREPSGTVSLDLARWVPAAGDGLDYTEIDLPQTDSLGDTDGSNSGLVTIFDRLKRGFSLGELISADAQSRVRGNY